MAWQVESQAPEVTQSEVLGLASLGTGALLLLGPQPSLIDVGWCVRVAGASWGPAHCICKRERESRRVVASGPSIWAKTAGTSLYDRPHAQATQPQFLSIPISPVCSPNRGA